MLHPRKHTNKLHIFTIRLLTITLLKYIKYTDLNKIHIIIFNEVPI